MGIFIFAPKVSVGYRVAILAMTLLLFVLQDTVANGKPYNLWPHYQTLMPMTETDCDHNDEIETLCQRCAKQTKSNVVYPMCCKNSEEAREWCQKYINFGLQ